MFVRSVTKRNTMVHALAAHHDLCTEVTMLTNGDDICERADSSVGSRLSWEGTFACDDCSASEHTDSDGARDESEDDPVSDSALSSSDGSGSDSASESDQAHSPRRSTVSDKGQKRRAPSRSRTVDRSDMRRRGGRERAPSRHARQRRRTISSHKTSADESHVELCASSADNSVSQDSHAELASQLGGLSHAGDTLPRGDIVMDHEDVNPLRVFPGLGVSYLSCNLLCGAPMLGLVGDAVSTWAESDIYVATQAHRDTIRSHPSFQTCVNLIGNNEFFPVLVLVCANAAESVVYSISLDGSVFMRLLQDLDADSKAHLLVRTIHVGGGAGVQQWPGESDADLARVSQPFRLRCHAEMSDAEQTGVLEMLRNSYALGAHLCKHGTYQKAVHDYWLLYFSRDGGVRVVVLEDPLRFPDANVPNSLMHQLYSFLGLRDQPKRSKLMALSDGTTFRAVNLAGNGMTVSVQTREYAVVVALQASHAVHRVISGGILPGGDDPRLNLSTCAPMPVGESLLLCFEALKLLSNDDYLGYLFGNVRYARKAVSGCFQTASGKKKLDEYLSRNPQTLMPSRVSFPVAVMALADSDNVRVSVQLLEARNLSQSKSFGHKSSATEREAADDENMPRPVNSDETDGEDETLTRLTPVDAAQFSLQDPYGYFTQSHYKVAPVAVNEYEGNSMQGTINVDAFQVTMTVSHVYVARSVPPELAHVTVFRGAGVDGGPPFSAIPVVSGIGPGMQPFFDETWSSARVEIRPVIIGKPDYVDVLFPNRRYGSDNARRVWYDDSMLCMESLPICVFSRVLCGTYKSMRTYVCVTALLRVTIRCVLFFDAQVVGCCRHIDEWHSRWSWACVSDPHNG